MTPENIAFMAAVLIFLGVLTIMNMVPSVDDWADGDGSDDQIIR